MKKSSFKRFFYLQSDIFGGKTKLAVEHLVGRRSTEVVEAENVAPGWRYNTPMISDWCLSQTKYLTLHHYGKEHKKKVHGHIRASDISYRSSDIDNQLEQNHEFALQNGI